MSHEDQRLPSLHTRAMSEWRAPTTGRHVHVVLRRDIDVHDLVDAIVGTKAFVTRDEAEAEATRLNALNANKRATYFVVVARLQDD
jgi:hypothetical protein